MPIQLGVPGAAGGGGGGTPAVTNEIVAASGLGRVTVEADGTVSIIPDSTGIIHVESDPTQFAPVMEWKDEVSLRMRMGIAQGDNNLSTGSVKGDFVMRTVGSNGFAWGLSGAGGLGRRHDQFGAIHHPPVGPHAWGRSSVPSNVQYTWAGTISLPGSDPRKFSLEGTMSGETGAQNYVGFSPSINMNTQALSEQVENMIGTDIPRLNITDLLTGGNIIVNAASMRIRGAPTEAQTNYALLIEEGLLSSDTLRVRGQVGFNNVALNPLPSLYTITNAADDRTFDADTVAIAELADVVATVINDLINYGLLTASGGG